MTSKNNIDAQVRGFYFSPGGKSEFDGATFERPKPTMQEAIDAAFALDPPPNPDAIAVVSSAQGGSFLSGFVLEDFIQFNGKNVSIGSSAAVGITMASFQICDITSLGMTSDSATGWLIDGQQTLAIGCDRINMIGANSIGVEITGTCDSLFFTTKQILLFGTGSIAFDITSSTGLPIDINTDTVEMRGDDTIFMNYNPVSGDDECVIDVSTIANGGANTTGFIIESGHLIIQAGVIDVTTAIHVKPGGELTLIASRVVGDIIVDAGGILHCLVVHHVSGTITNNGVINGIIGGTIDDVYFGAYRQKPKQSMVLLASDATTQSPVGLDNPLQVKFGPAQFGPSDPVQIDASGTIQINETNQYSVSLTLQYGRIGAGSFSLLFFRALIDDVQIGRSQSAKIDNANSNFPVEFNFTLDLVSRQILKVELWRDSTGFDAGSLFPETPTLAGANDTPSALISLSTIGLVQEPQPKVPVIAGLVGLYDELGIVGNPVTTWRNSVVGLPDFDFVVGTAANLTQITALGHSVVNASGGVGLQTSVSTIVFSPLTVFMVIKFNSATPAAQIIMDARILGINDRILFETREFNSDRFTISQGGSLRTLAEPYDTLPHIWTGQFNGDATTKLTVSGVGEVTGDAGADNWDFGSLFADIIGSSTSEAYIATLLVFDRALSAAETLTVEAFLTDKYGL